MKKRYDNEDEAAAYKLVNKRKMEKMEQERQKTNDDINNHVNNIRNEKEGTRNKTNDDMDNHVNNKKIK